MTFQEQMAKIASDTRRIREVRLQFEREMRQLNLKGDGGGHIGDYRDKTQQFIDGCRKSHAANETLEFH